MELLLADELLIVALGRPGRVPGDAEVRLPYVLAGALLTELVATRRVACDGRKLAPFNPWPTGRAGLDAILHRMRNSNDGTVDGWIHKGAFTPRLLGRLRDDLLRSEVLVRRRRVTWSPVPTDFVPAATWKLDAVTGGVLRALRGETDARSAALAQLAWVARLVERLGPKPEHREIRNDLATSWSDVAFGRAVGQAFESARGLESELAGVFRITTELADKADLEAHRP